MSSNRASAQRSRQRKQDRLDELEVLVWDIIQVCQTFLFEFISICNYNWVRSQVDTLHWSNCWGQRKIVTSKPNFQYEYLHLIAPCSPSTFLLLFTCFGSCWVAVLVQSFSQSTNHKMACWKCLGSARNPSLIIFWSSVDCPVATGERHSAAQVKTGCADGKEIWDGEEQPGKESGGVDERAEVGSLPTARYTRF